MRAIKRNAYNYLLVTSDITSHNIRSDPKAQSAETTEMFVGDFLESFIFIFISNVITQVENIVGLSDILLYCTFTMI